MAALDVRPITGHIGAEVHGVDLRRVSPSTHKLLHEAWLEHKVLFFRDQQMTTEQHIDFGRLWGELEVHPFIEDDGGHPEIVVLESTKEKPSAASAWHSDVTWRQEPSMGSILYARAVPPVGGDTLWCDATAAYDALPEFLKERCDGLVAVHDFVQTFGRGLSEEELEEKRREYPPAEHPVIRTHPETGRKGIYVNRPFTSHIVDLEPQESEEILSRLCLQIASPHFQCRFRWQADSVAMWDNRCTQHFVAADFFPAYRRVERVTVAGDRPV